MQRLEELFHRAVRLDLNDRVAFVTRLRNSTPDLAVELEALLEAHGRSGTFMDSPAQAAASAIGEEAPGFHSGQALGRYTVLHAIGRGGMGEVYLAEDAQLGRKVALKLLPERYVERSDRLRRFTQEARAASALNHPNIITIHEIGEFDGMHFIATEYIEGETLRSHLSGEQLPLAEVLDIAIQMAGAVEAAHAAGIIHRDIKPENVMLRRDGYVKLLDFGLAKLTESGEQNAAIDSQVGTAIIDGTRPGVVMGTPKYMSPEQARGLALDSRSDIFSLGVVMYEMATGHAPFSGDTNADVAVSILTREPPSPSRYTRDVPPQLERIVMKALRKDRRQRYQSVRDLLLDVKSLQEEIAFDARRVRSRGPSAAALPEGASDAVDRPAAVAGSTKRRVVATLFLVGLVAATSIALALLWPPARPASEPPAGAAAAAERSLRYSILVQKYRDGRPFQEPIRLRDDINFEKDYRIRLNVVAPDQGFLYLVNEGPTLSGDVPSFVVMFPTALTKHNSARIEAGQDIQIPAQSWFQFDAQEGTEKIWLVWATHSVDALEGAKRFANSRDRGLVTDPDASRALDAFLRSHASPQPSVERDDATTETVVRANGEVLAHLVKLSHH